MDRETLLRATVGDLHSAAVRVQELEDINAELLEALEAVTSPEFQQAYRDGAAWAIEAQTKARDAIKKAKS